MIQNHEFACLQANFHVNAFADCAEIFTPNAVYHKLHVCTSWRKSANSSSFHTFSKMVIFQRFFNFRQCFSQNCFEIAGKQL